MTEILITGNRGFVGSNFHRSYRNDKSVTITGIDLKDHIDVRDFVKYNNKKYDIVIHLAAIVGGRQTIEDSPLSVATDLSIDSEIINWALRTKPGRFIYFSSSAAYPINLQSADFSVRLDEELLDLTNISNPDLTYGWSKLTGEYLCQFLEAEGIRTHVFRPFSGYGTDQDTSYPFPKFIERASKRMDPFEIWGNGEQTRDFIHITDIVNAVKTAIDLDVRGPVNLGLGRQTSFNELAELVTNIAGYQPEFQHITSAPVGVTHRISNPDKLLSFYKPKISLEQGIDLALRNVIGFSEGGS